MDLTLPWPTTQGEWLAWWSAIVTCLFGLLLLFAPRLSFRILRLTTVDAHPEAIAVARSTMSGFYLGLGLCCLLLAQPLLYMALGVCWAFTAFGRIIGMLSDNASTPYHWVGFAVDVVLAALPLLYAFGLFP